MSIPTIAILIDTSTGWGRRTIRGILDCNIQHGPWDLLIEPKGQNETFRVPADSDCDGIIARVSSERMARELHDLNIPVVNVSGLNVPGADFPRVATDYNASAKLAMTHFQDRALRDAAYVGPLQLFHVREHEMAFEATLADSGMTCHIFHPSTELGHSIPAAIRDNELIPWLINLPKPVGIFSWGYQLGRDIVSACRQANIPVPDDIAVLGGDYDALLSDACHPSLSGIITPAQQIGYRAATLLHEMIKGSPPPEEPVFLQAEEIEERQSTDIMAIDDPLMLKALTFTRDNACSDIGVDDILRAAPMARRKLERLFMRFLGRAPAQEIRRIRINHARKLLARTNMDMQDVSEACGYANYNYLGAVFKRETGISPGRYRKQMRGV